MKITSINVVLLPGVIPSVAFISDIEQPEAFFHKGPFIMKADLPHSGWQEFLNEHFVGIPVNIIDTR